MRPSGGEAPDAHRQNDPDPRRVGRDADTADGQVPAIRAHRNRRAAARRRGHGRRRTGAPWPDIRISAAGLVRQFRSRRNPPAGRRPQCRDGCNFASGANENRLGPQFGASERPDSGFAAEFSAECSAGRTSAWNWTGPPPGGNQHGPEMRARPQRTNDRTDPENHSRKHMADARPGMPARALPQQPAAGDPPPGNRRIPAPVSLARAAVPRFDRLDKTL